MNHWLIDFFKMVAKDMKRQWTKWDTLIVFLAVYLWAMNWMIKALLGGGK